MILARVKKTIKNALYLGLSITLISLGLSFLSQKVEKVQAVEGSGPNLTADLASANDAHPETGWSDNTPADPGNTVEYDLQVGNTNVPSEAGNLTVHVTLPETVGGTNVARLRVTTTTACTVQGCNTAPEDTTTVNLSSDSTGLVYVAGSTRVTADLNQDGTKEYDGATWADGITEGGINLGAFNGGAGKIQISFQAKVLGSISPNLTANLLAQNLSVGPSTWADSTAANVNQTVKFYFELHNTNVPSQANNVRIKAAIPGDFATTSVVTLTVTADNATTVSDPTTITFPSSLKLIYTPGSTRLTWDYNGDGNKDYNDAQWDNDDLVGANGLLLPQPLFGCNQYILQLTFLATVAGSATPTPTPTPTPTVTPGPTATPTPTPTPGPAAPGCTLSIDKKIRLDDGREVDSVEAVTHVYVAGETITYRLFISNTSAVAVPNVTVQDFLAPYMTFVSGDLAFDPGANRLDSNQGTFNGNEARTLTYTAKVKDSIPSGNTTQQNTAKVFFNGVQCATNTASIVIGKPGSILTVATQLPVTGGAAEGTVLLSSGLALLGCLLRDFSPAKRKRIGR